MLATKLLGGGDLKINLVGLDEPIGYEGPGEDVSSSRQLNTREGELSLAARLERNRSKMVHHLREYQADFDPRSIRHFVLRKIASQKAIREDDVFKMVRIGVEEGNDFQEIETATRSECLRELRMLRNTYRLVSEGYDNSCGKTLSLVCQSFPLVTCSYLPFAFNPTVSFYRMDSVSKNYPKVMMNSAFAYLVPNTDDEYCSLLRKAHMLHQFEFHLIVSDVHRTNTSIIRETQLVPVINRYTEVAIRKSHFKHDERIAFLKEYNLIYAANADVKIVVAEEVFRAAKLWEKLEKKIINLKI